MMAQIWAHKKIEKIHLVAKNESRKVDDIVFFLNYSRSILNSVVFSFSHALILAIVYKRRMHDMRDRQGFDCSRNQKCVYLSVVQVAPTTENKPELAIFRPNSSGRTLKTAQQRSKTTIFVFLATCTRAESKPWLRRPRFVNPVRVRCIRIIFGKYKNTKFIWVLWKFYIRSNFTIIWDNFIFILYYYFFYRYINNQI